MRFPRPTANLTSSHSPRKINSLINAHGFECKGGKIVAKGDGADATLSPAGKKTGEASSAAAPKTPTSSRKKLPTTPKAAKLPKTPASKKRKIEQPAEEVKNEIDNKVGEEVKNEVDDKIDNAIENAANDQKEGELSIEDFNLGLTNGE